MPDDNAEVVAIVYPSWDHKTIKLLWESGFSRSADRMHLVWALIYDAAYNIFTEHTSSLDNSIVHYLSEQLMRLTLAPHANVPLKAECTGTELKVWSRCPFVLQKNAIVFQD